MTTHARRSADVVSKEQGDYIARMVLEVVREVGRRNGVFAGVEPTGVYVDRDVERFVLRRAS